jgi:hypothetical protein
VRDNAFTEAETSGVRTASVVNMNTPNGKVTGRFENVTEIEVDATQTHILAICRPARRFTCLVPRDVFVGHR